MSTNFSINGQKSQQPVKSPWKLEKYVKSQAGVFITPSKTCSLDDSFVALPYINEAFGFKAQKGNFFVSGENGVGTSVTGKIATGYEIPIGKQFGLELSADARVAESLIGKKNIEINTNTNAMTQIVLEDSEGNELLTVRNLQANNHIEARYNEGSMAAGANIMAKYHPIDNLSYGIGVRAAVVSGNAANVNIKQNLVSDNKYAEGNINHSHNNDVRVTIGEEHTQFVVSPVLEIEAATDSEKGWEIGTRFSFDELKLSAAYKF
jgi:hypothetical protein